MAKEIKALNKIIENNYILNYIVETENTTGFQRQSSVGAVYSVKAS